MGKPLLLIEAAESYRLHAEDRLTELLATTLDAHPGFAGALEDKLGLPPAVRREFQTQVWTDRSCRVDMTIRTFGSNDERVSVVYSEHKREGYWFSEGQAQREREALNRELGDEKRLICVIPAEDLAALRATTPAASRKVLPADAFDQALTWDDIMRLADDAGSNWSQPWGGRGWTKRALTPEAPAAQRVLAEFLSYLEGGEVLGAISEADVTAFELAEQAHEKVEALMTLASEKGGPYVAVRDDKGDLLIYDDTETNVALIAINFDAPPRHWLRDLEDATLTLAIAPADAASPSGTGQPTIYAGLYLDGAEGDAAQADSQWMSVASEAEFRMLPYPEGLWLCRAVQLSWLLDQGTTLEEQAAALSKWLVDAFDAATHLPGRPPPGAEAAAGGRRIGR